MPTPRRMTTPGYGFEDVREPGAKLAWTEITALLEAARTYWIATTRPDSRPHVAPVWGIWSDDAFVFETASTSIKWQNIETNRSVAMHIDHSEASVIVEGTATRVWDETMKLAYASACKSKYDFDVDPYLARRVSRVIAITPRVVYSYREHLGQTATRWEF